MRSIVLTTLVSIQSTAFAGGEGADTLGLPPLNVPADNAQTAAKVALGDRLFHGKRFSSTGEVSCSTSHDDQKAFTDSPLQTSGGINKLHGTRNAPTVLNAAFNETQFWDGRSPDLEDQAQHPFVNPVEMGLADHEPILTVVRSDPEYVAAFKEVFGTEPADPNVSHLGRFAVDDQLSSIGAFKTLTLRNIALTAP